MKTYKDFWNELNEEFHFTVDVAADEHNHMTPKYYTPKEDGLKQSWSNEIVWCNPPYPWNEWLQKTRYQTSLTTIVMMIPARDKLELKKLGSPDEIRFIGKLKFECQYQYPDDLMLLIWR